MKPYRNSKRWQARSRGGQFRRWTLEDMNTGTAICPRCGAINPYTLVNYEDNSNGFIMTIQNFPPDKCSQCGGWIDYDPIDYSADDGSGNRQPDSITPDPAGDDVADNRDYGAEYEDYIRDQESAVNDMIDEAEERANLDLTNPYYTDEPEPEPDFDPEQPDDTDMGLFGLDEDNPDYID